MFCLLLGGVRYHTEFSWSIVSNAKLNILFFINKLFDVNTLMGCSFQQPVWSEGCFSILEVIILILSFNSWCLIWYLSNHKFDMSKCQILNLGQSYTGHEYELWEELLESYPAQRDLGLLDLGQHIGGSQQCALAVQRANCILGCIKHSMTSWAKEGIIPLYLVLMWPHFEHWGQFCDPPFKRDIQVLECGQRRTTQLMKGLEVTILSGVAEAFGAHLV